LAERRISLELTERAGKYLAKKGFDPVYGARPLKRVIQKELETAIGFNLIKGEIPEGAHVIVDHGDGQLTFTSRVDVPEDPEE
jgi:ATP-dependent Clp protease ATP-binding subunit ClpB